jgi:hypothetical protein
MLARERPSYYKNPSTANIKRPQVTYPEMNTIDKEGKPTKKENLLIALPSIATFSIGPIRFHVIIVVLHIVL